MPVTLETPSAPPGKVRVTGPLRILLVDDDRTSRAVLRAFLLREGHEIFTAGDGAEGVEVYERERPDVVFMDVKMPVMNGMESAGLIQKSAGDEIVPIIFLTGLSAEEVLAECLDNGGTDFLTKPYNKVILRSKLQAAARLREMWKISHRQNQQLLEHKERMEHEQRIANEVLQRMHILGASQDGRIRSSVTPLEVFSGDCVLSVRRPTGEMHVLVADSTGHGLLAALACLPVCDIFRAMTLNGSDIANIATEVNRKLNRTLPTGLYCAAALIQANLDNGRVKVWNGGLPDLLVRGLGGGVTQTVPSRNLPLGILKPEDFDPEIQQLSLQVGDRLLAYSDGLTEANNEDGEAFGSERLKRRLSEPGPGDSIFDLVLSDHQAFVGNAPAEDDLTLVEVHVAPGAHSSRGPEQTAPKAKAALLGENGVHPEWKMKVRLEADALRTMDPVPSFVNSLASLPGLSEHKAELFTILAELFTNALDHGVLELESKLKHDPAGFQDYYEQRTKRLEELRDGTVELGFRLWTRQDARAGELEIEVSDSGAGFDPEAAFSALENNPGFSGRGLALIRELCATLSHNARGNRVTAIYAWCNDCDECCD